MNLLVGDIINVRVRGNLFSQNVITTFCYKLGVQGSSTDTQTQLLAFNAAFKTSINSPYAFMLAAISSSWGGLQIISQQVTPGKSVQVKTSIGGDVGARGIANTANIAYVVSKNTDLAGRSQLGSWHLPGVDITDIDDGFVEVAQVARLQAFADKAVLPFTVTALGAQWIPQIFHRNNPPVAPSTASSIFQTTVRDTVRTMRRRTVNVGE